MTNKILPEEQIEHDMALDMQDSLWFKHKVRTSDIYAQNLYAAICNMQWQKLDVIPILKDEYWACSWRVAGGIVAQLLGKGDYLDWYCTGIFNEGTHRAGHVEEGVVTEEIEADLKKLGWQPVPYEK